MNQKNDHSQTVRSRRDRLSKAVRPACRPYPRGALGAQALAAAACEAPRRGGLPVRVGWKRARHHDPPVRSPKRPRHSVADEHVIGLPPAESHRCRGLFRGRSASLPHRRGPAHRSRSPRSKTWPTSNRSRPCASLRRPEIGPGPARPRIEPSGKRAARPARSRRAERAGARESARHARARERRQEDTQ